MEESDKYIFNYIYNNLENKSIQIKDNLKLLNELLKFLNCLDYFNNSNHKLKFLIYFLKELNNNSNFDINLVVYFLNNSINKTNNQIQIINKIYLFYKLFSNTKNSINKLFENELKIKNTPFKIALNNIKFRIFNNALIQDKYITNINFKTYLDSIVLIIQYNDNITSTNEIQTKLNDNDLEHKIKINQISNNAIIFECILDILEVPLLTFLNLDNVNLEYKLCFLKNIFKNKNIPKIYDIINDFELKEKALLLVIKEETLKLNYKLDIKTEFFKLLSELYYYNFHNVTIDHILYYYREIIPVKGFESKTDEKRIKILENYKRDFINSYYIYYLRDKPDKIGYLGFIDFKHNKNIHRFKILDNDLNNNNEITIYKTLKNCYGFKSPINEIFINKKNLVYTKYFKKNLFLKIRDIYIDIDSDIYFKVDDHWIKYNNQLLEPIYSQKNINSNDNINNKLSASSSNTINIHLKNSNISKLKNNKNYSSKNLSSSKLNTVNLNSNNLKNNKNFKNKKEFEKSSIFKNIKKELFEINSLNKYDKKDYYIHLNLLPEDKKAKLLELLKSQDFITKNNRIIIKNHNLDSTINLINLVNEYTKCNSVEKYDERLSQELFNLNNSSNKAHTLTFALELNTELSNEEELKQQIKNQITSEFNNVSESQIDIILRNPNHNGGNSKQFGEKIKQFGGTIREFIVMIKEFPKESIETIKEIFKKGKEISTNISVDKIVDIKYDDRQDFNEEHDMTSLNGKAIRVEQNESTKTTTSKQTNLNSTLTDAKKKAVDAAKQKAALDAKKKAADAAKQKAAVDAKKKAADNAAKKKAAANAAKKKAAANAAKKKAAANAAKKKASANAAKKKATSDAKHTAAAKNKGNNNESLKTAVQIQDIVYAKLVGIKNERNTCFFNTHLQLLYHIPECKEAVLNYKAQSQFILSFKSMFNKLNNSTEKFVEILTELQILQGLDNNNGFGTQFGEKVLRIGYSRDADEFTLKSIDRMKESGLTEFTDLLKCTSSSKSYYYKNQEKIFITNNNGEVKVEVQHNECFNVYIPYDVFDSPNVEVSIDFETYLLQCIHFQQENDIEYTTQAGEHVFLTNERNYEFGELIFCKVTRYITEDTNLPIKYRFKESPFLVTIKGYNYILRGFISHPGGAHYIYFLRKKSNIWYKYNDMTTETFTDGSIKAKLQDSRNTVFLLEKVGKSERTVNYDKCIQCNNTEQLRRILHYKVCEQCYSKYQRDKNRFLYNEASEELEQIKERKRQLEIEKQGRANQIQQQQQQQQQELDRAEQERQRLEQESQQAEHHRLQAEQERQRLEQESQQAEEAAAVAARAQEEKERARQAQIDSNAVFAQELQEHYRQLNSLETAERMEAERVQVEREAERVARAAASEAAQAALAAATQQAERERVAAAVAAEAAAEAAQRERARVEEEEAARAAANAARQEQLILQLEQRKRNFLNMQFVTKRGTYSEDSVDRASLNIQFFDQIYPDDRIPFPNTAQAPLFHGYINENTSTKIIVKIDNAFYMNLPQKVRDIVDPYFNLEQIYGQNSNLSIFFTVVAPQQDRRRVDPLNLNSELASSSGYLTSFKPHYFYLPHRYDNENNLPLGRLSNPWGGAADDIQLRPKVKFIKINDDHTPPDQFHFNIRTQITVTNSDGTERQVFTDPLQSQDNVTDVNGGYTPHPRDGMAVISPDSPYIVNFHGPIMLYSIINDQDGNWTKCAISLTLITRDGIEKVIFKDACRNATLGEFCNVLHMRNQNLSKPLESLLGLNF